MICFPKCRLQMVELEWGGTATNGVTPFIFFSYEWLNNDWLMASYFSFQFLISNQSHNQNYFNFMWLYIQTFYLKLPIENYLTTPL